MAKANTYSTKELTGTRVVGGKKGDKRIGKVSRFVFHPSEKRCVGFMVKRPDLALMFHRKDLFIPLDGFEMEDGRIRIPHGEAAMEGKGAIDRLGLDWDRCVLWQSMPLLSESGEELGYVGDIAFLQQSGKVVSVEATRGATAKALLGELRIPTSLIKGFKTGVGTPLAESAEDEEGEEDILTGAILVSNEAVALQPEGGLAEKAGQDVAAAKDQVEQAKAKAKPKMDEAAKATGDALNKGAYVTGRQIRRAQGMFAAFKEEYEKAVDDDD